MLRLLQKKVQAAAKNGDNTLLGTGRAIARCKLLHTCCWAEQFAVHQHRFIACQCKACTLVHAADDTWRLVLAKECLTNSALSRAVETLATGAVSMLVGSSRKSYSLWPCVSACHGDI